MNRSFVYPEHPEFKEHVEYVTGELLDMRHQILTNGGEREKAEARAKDIVLWVTSKPINNWHDFNQWSFGYFAGAVAGALITWLVLTI